MQTASFHSVLGAGLVWLCHSSPIQEEFWVSGSQDARYLEICFESCSDRGVSVSILACMPLPTSAALRSLPSAQFLKFGFGTVVCFFCSRNGPLLMLLLVESVSALTRLGFSHSFAIAGSFSGVGSSAFGVSYGLLFPDCPRVATPHTQCRSEVSQHSVPFRVHRLAP